MERHSPQIPFYGPYRTKSVRYDVYSEINGRVFDVEMQMESRKNESRRARYYQCMMDEQELRKGEDYAVLPELKNFLNLINGNAPADDFCREVQEQVREARKDARKDVKKGAGKSERPTILLLFRKASFPSRMP
ncbi:PD-(D/E)XK nuclease family transposase [Bacillota bacterium LCP21S3_D9]